MDEATRKKYAAELGRAGGTAAAKLLTPEQRTAKAKKAANARWKKSDPKPEGVAK